MKQLYLCGAISGNPHYKEEFELARKMLSQVGYAVCSPLEFCKKNWSYEECIRMCIRVLSTKDAIAIVNNIKNSMGALLEVHIGRMLRMQIMDVEAWLLNENEGL